MIKKIGIICLVLFLAFAILPRLTLAQAPAFLESRIVRLETENFQLRSQMQRIESQLAQLSGQRLPQQPSSNRRTPQVHSGTNRRQLLPAEREQMFDRLATLVIELKERVQTLEAQVAALKKQQG
jgi:outer membrane murein-binding lipoprotein Lpp